MFNIRFRGFRFVVFSVSLLASVIAAKNAHSAKVCAGMPYSIRIIDESSGTQFSGAALSERPDSPFKSFVSAVSGHIAKQIAQTGACGGANDRHSEITLSFVYRPLIASRAAPAGGPVDPASQQSNVACHLDSPWVRLAISRAPKLIVRAVFTWNERQFLVDQAWMAGADAAHMVLPVPIDNAAFEKYASDYTDAILRAPSREARTAALAAIEKRMPADLLWLFSHSWQSTLAPFSTGARHDLGVAIGRAAPAYAMLTNALVDRCFTAPSPAQRYDSILDLHAVFTLEQYQIDRLH